MRLAPIGVVRLLTAAIVTSALLAGCSAAGFGQQTPSPEPPNPTDAPPKTNESSVRASKVCPSGSYRVQSFVGKTAIPTPAGDTEVSGEGGGMLLTFTDEEWTLSGEPGNPIRAKIGRLSAELIIDGSATGTYASTEGDGFTFSTDSSDGSAQLSGAGLNYEIPMDQASRAIAPSGQVSLTCNKDKLTLDSDTVTMKLARG